MHIHLRASNGSNELEGIIMSSTPANWKIWTINENDDDDYDDVCMYKWMNVCYVTIITKE